MTDPRSRHLKSHSKRFFSSSTEESDVSVCGEPDSLDKREQNSKRHHTDTNLTADMEQIQAALSRLENRVDGLATKEGLSSFREELSSFRTTFMEKISALEGRLFEMESQREKQGEEIKQLKKKNETLHNTIKQQDSKMKEVEREQNDLDQYSRRNHLRVFRVPERDGETVEDCAKKICRVCTDSVGVDIKPADIEIAHRTGRRSSDKPRPILVRFFDRKKRDLVLGNRRRLKGKGTSIGEDLTVANYRLLRRAMDHTATMSAWASSGRILAKMKNGVIVKINIHSDLDEAFRRAMSPGDISLEENRRE